MFNIMETVARQKLHNKTLFHQIITWERLPVTRSIDNTPQVVCVRQNVTMDLRIFPLDVET